MIRQRRKHPRLRIPLEAEYLVAGREEWREGTIWTLGAGGAALLCEEELAVGTELAGLHFVVEAEGDLPETRIEVGAEVVNVGRQDDFGRTSNFMLGLRFTGLGEQEFKLLKQFVFRRLTGPRGPAARAGEASEDKVAPPIEIRFKLFDEFVSEVSENLSPSGMFIPAHRPPPPGSRFVFQFQLGEDFSLFQGTAEVVWTRRRSEGPDRPPGMGVRFIQLDLTSQRMVDRLVGERGGTDEAPGDEAPGDETADGPPSRTAGRALELSSDAEPFAIDVAAPIRAEGGADAEPPTAAPASDEGDVDGQPPAAATAADEGSRLAARLGRQVAGLEKRLDDAAAATAELEERTARLAGENETLEKEATALRAENRSLREARDEAEQARGRAEDEASELHRELELLRPDDELEEKLKLSSAESERQREEWRSREAELRAELEERDAGQAELSERLERAEETEAELRAELEERDASQAELRERLERAEETEAELCRRLERARDTEDGLREKLEGALEEVAELRERLERAGESEAEARQSLEQAAGVEAELRQQLTEAETWRDDLEHQSERADDAETRVESLQQELDDTLREWQATEAELRAQLEHKSSEKAELNDRLTEAVGAEAELRQRLGEVRGARDDLEVRLAQSRQIESELRDQARELRAGRDEMASKLLRATARLERMHTAAAQMRSRFNGDLSAAEALGADLASRLDEVAEVGAGLDRKVARLTEARSSLAVHLTRITEAWSSLEAGLEEAELEADVAEAPSPPVAAEAEAGPQITLPTLPVAAAATDAEAAPVEAEAVEPDTAPAADEAQVATPSDPPSATSPPVEAADAPPRPKGAARLVGAMRRTAARLGFGGADSSSDNGGGRHAEPEASESPAAETESPAEDDGADPAAIEETVRAWAAAWSEQRVEDYLSFYSRDFAPARSEGDAESGEAPHAWLPPLAGMELSLGPISQTELAPGRFAVHFEQSVESDSYSRRTGRTLEMVREADSWKIAAESFQDLTH